MARIVFVTGDKGGVGKSFTSRMLIDWFESEGRSIIALDTDKTNSTLFRFFEEKNSDSISIEQLDTDDPVALDEFLDLAATTPNQIYLVDCAARTMDSLAKWMRDVDFSAVAKEMGIRVTLAFVLGPEKDCVAILRDVLEEFQNRVEYVVVKNLGRGNDFSIYEGSKARDRLINEFKGIEIEIPLLFSKTALMVDRMNLPFSSAIETEKLGIADRSRIRAFRAKAHSEIGLISGPIT